MKIEIEMGNTLTIGALRQFVEQVERSGGDASAYVTFSKRRGDGVVVACADFEPAALAAEALYRQFVGNDG